jgi:hypothetical protein
MPNHNYSGKIFKWGMVLFILMSLIFSIVSATEIHSSNISDNKNGIIYNNLAQTFAFIAIGMGVMTLSPLSVLNEKSS